MEAGDKAQFTLSEMVDRSCLYTAMFSLYRALKYTLSPESEVQQAEMALNKARRARAKVCRNNRGAREDRARAAAAVADWSARAYDVLRRHGALAGGAPPPAGLRARGHRAHARRRRQAQSRAQHPNPAEERGQHRPRADEELRTTRRDT